MWQRIAKVQDSSKHFLQQTRKTGMSRRTARTFLCINPLQCAVVLPDLPFLVESLHLYSHRQGQHGWWVRMGGRLAAGIVYPSNLPQLRVMHGVAVAAQPRRGKGME